MHALVLAALRLLAVLNVLSAQARLASPARFHFKRGGAGVVLLHLLAVLGVLFTQARLASPARLHFLARLL